MLNGGGAKSWKMSELVWLSSENKAHLDISTMVDTIPEYLDDLDKVDGTAVSERDLSVRTRPI